MITGNLPFVVGEWVGVNPSEERKKKSPGVRVALNTYLRPSSIRRGSVFFPVKCAERGVADCRRSSIKK